MACRNSNIFDTTVCNEYERKERNGKIFSFLLSSEMDLDISFKLNNVYVWIVSFEAEEKVILLTKSQFQKLLFRIIYCLDNVKKNSQKEGFKTEMSFSLPLPIWHHRMLDLSPLVTMRGIGGEDMNLVIETFTRYDKTNHWGFKVLPKVCITMRQIEINNLCSQVEDICKIINS
jgi:hypothetical protein